MLKKVITYEDFDGNKRTDTCWFNLTKAECMEMELIATGGMQKMIQQIIDEQDSKRLVAIFKEIILKSYGEKSADGRYFKKSKEISENFAATGAYSELFMELATNADAASEFINGVIPQVSEEGN